MAYGFSRCQDWDSTPRPHDHSAHVPLQPAIVKLDFSESALQMTEASVELLPPLSSKTAEQPSDAATPCYIVQMPADEDVRSCSPNPTPLPLPKMEGLLSQCPTGDDPFHSSDIADTAEMSAASNKRSKSSLDSISIDGPARKRVKISDGASQNVGQSNATEFHEEKKPKAAFKKRRKDPATSDAFNSTSASKRKRSSKYLVEESDSESSTPSSSSSSRASSMAPPRLTFSDGANRDRNGIAEADAEICGMIIEGMATSRASSLPIPQICRIVLQSRPSMKAERDEKEWHDVFDRVLRSGVTGRGSGVFGKVDSSYKVRQISPNRLPFLVIADLFFSQDENNPAAEARWFYVPEMDCDQERAALIRSMMPRPGKRSVTKKYKQYYYQPLDKISRWDPEDDL